MTSLMTALFPPGGPAAGAPPGPAGEEQRAFMHHFHSAFGRLVAAGGAPPTAVAMAHPPFDPAALFGGQPPAAPPAGLEAVPQALAPAAPAAAAAPGGEADVKQEQADEAQHGQQGRAEASPTLATPAGQAPLAEGEAEATISKAGAQHTEQCGDAVAPADGPQQQQEVDTAAQPAVAAAAQGQPALQDSGSGSGTTLGEAGARVAPADAPQPAPEQAALQQQALYIGQVMMSLASVFPGMAAAISAMCGMAAAAGFTAPHLPPVRVHWDSRWGRAGRGPPGRALCPGTPDSADLPTHPLPDITLHVLHLLRPLTGRHVVPCLCRACSPRGSCRWRWVGCRPCRRRWRWAPRPSCRHPLARCCLRAWRGRCPRARPSARRCSWMVSRLPSLPLPPGSTSPPALPASSHAHEPGRLVPCAAVRAAMTRGRKVVTFPGPARGGHHRQVPLLCAQRLPPHTLPALQAC